MKTFNKYLENLSTKDASVYFNEPLKNHCSFGIGGKAKFFIIVNNLKTLKEVLTKSKQNFLLGAGTNTLFKDKNFNGTIIKLGKNFQKTKIIKTTEKEVVIEVGAAVNLFTLNTFLQKNGITGLEWSYGIPGSVGGATIMNAGAFEYQFGDFVKEVKIIKNGKASWNKDFTFSYRNSSFKENNSIILAVKLLLKIGDNKEIKKQQLSFINKRKETQPYGEKCAGSIFKRIIKDNQILFPAKIIDNIGLKGVRIGRAEVSKKHAGFIINSGNAKAKDVLNLIKLIKRKVKKSTGELLQEEIIIF
ncbi:MAG: UDP-N-acetylmuramate dehydrogenase [Clostridia bacterium]|nr:UDP-N-acetylmuramate dehydrogenase [Clostridia bacterium]